MSDRITIDDIRRAEKAIVGRVVRTPSVESPGMTRTLGAATALKIETQQIAGCFKLRGIVNKILSLSEGERAWGLVTVSGGNHGIAIAELAPMMGTKVTVVMPETAPQSSIDRIRSAGANLILAPDSTVAFELAGADQYRDLTYIHSYDDAVIMGCLIAAARRVIERVGADARVVLVLCGGNVSFSDVGGWIERFDIRR